MTTALLIALFITMFAGTATIGLALAAPDRVPDTIRNRALGAAAMVVGAGLFGDAVFSAFYLWLHAATLL